MLVWLLVMMKVIKALKICYQFQEKMFIDASADEVKYAELDKEKSATDCFCFSEAKSGVSGLSAEASGATGAFWGRKEPSSAASVIFGLCPNICIKDFIFSDSVKSSDVEPPIDICSIDNGEKRESALEVSRQL